MAAILKLLPKHPESLTSSAPLYLTLLRKERQWCEATVWYACSSVGVNQIDKFMETIVTKAGLGATKKRFTKSQSPNFGNLVQQTREKMAITGHKNEQSLADYDTLDVDDH